MDRDVAESVIAKSGEGVGGGLTLAVELLLLPPPQPATMNSKGARGLQDARFREALNARLRLCPSVFFKSKYIFLVVNIIIHLGPRGAEDYAGGLLQVELVDCA
jgi:hypothetical protein